MSTISTSTDGHPKSIPFGKPMLEYFCMDPGYTNLNATSCGSWPISVRDQLRKFLTELEAQPDIFSELKQGQVIQEARSAVAQLLNANVSECVFVSNATTGIYTVLHNLPFQGGDVIITLSTTYGAIDNAIISLAEIRHVQGRKLEFEFPISGKEIVSRFEDMVGQIKAEGLHIRVAIIETIVSIPAVRMPFEDLVRVCQREKIMTLVDGAHSIGQIHVDLDKLQPDFFITDCHKWLFVPRPCAALYVPKRNQRYIRTTIPPSFGFIPKGGKQTLPLWSKQTNTTSTPSEFETLFAYTATSDNIPHMCIPTALRFRQEVCGGEDAIYEYLRVLAKEGGDMVASILKTDVLDEPLLEQHATSQMRNCGIATVRLPLAIADRPHVTDTPYPPLAEEEVGAAVQYLSMTLARSYKTWLPIIDYGGWIWVRMCAQIYLELSNFEWAGSILKSLCEKIGKREWVLESNVDSL